MTTFGGSGSRTGAGQTRFQRSIARPTPTGRETRTTAGSADIYKDRRSRGGRYGARPFSDLVLVAARLHQETRELPPHEVVNLGYVVRNIVAAQGARYHVKGRGGEKFKLEAQLQRNRKVLRDPSGAMMFTTRGRTQLGALSGSSVSVAGTPRGFWRIIEDGSQPHLITPRASRGGMRQKSVFGAFLRSAGLKIDRATGEAVEAGPGFQIKAFRPGGRPLKLTGKGGGGRYAAWVLHPGHKSIGKPWQKSMHLARPAVDRFHKDYVNSVLLAAWAR